MPSFEAKPEGLGSFFSQLRRALSKEAAEMYEAAISSSFKKMSSRQGHVFKCLHAPG